MYFYRETPNQWVLVYRLSFRGSNWEVSLFSYTPICVQNNALLEGQMIGIRPIRPSGPIAVFQFSFKAPALQTLQGDTLNVLRRIRNSITRPIRRPHPTMFTKHDGGSFDLFSLLVLTFSIRPKFKSKKKVVGVSYSPPTPEGLCKSLRWRPRLADCRPELLLESQG